MIIFCSLTTFKNFSDRKVLIQCYSASKTQVLKYVLQPFKYKLFHIFHNTTIFLSFIVSYTKRRKKTLQVQSLKAIIIIIINIFNANKKRATLNFSRLLPKIKRNELEMKWHLHACFS